MRDVLGWRKKFGVLGPSTNTIVQPDFDMMRPPGVTNHYSRIFTPELEGREQRDLHGRRRDHQQQRAGCGAQRDDLRARLPRDGHVGGHVLRRRQGRRRIPGEGRARGRRRRQHRLAFLHGGAEGLWWLQAHRVPHAVLSGRERSGAPVFRRLRLHGRARHLPEMPELDRHRRGAARGAARAADRARTARRTSMPSSRSAPISAWCASRRRRNSGSASR